MFCSLEAVAEECNKTTNVDLDLLINEYQRGSQLVTNLKSVEVDPVCQVKAVYTDLHWINSFNIAYILWQNALKQLTVSQAHNLGILLKKKSQLDQASLVPSSDQLGISLLTF